MPTCLPIKDIKEIRAIEKLFIKKKQPSHLLMFLLSINTGIDLTELLNLKVKDVKNKSCLVLGKQKSIPLSNKIIGLINEEIKGKKKSDYLFENSRGNKFDRALVFCAFKDTCEELGLNENYSLVSWRKTFAYHHYMKYKDLSYIGWLFNHNNINQTLKFIDEVVKTHKVITILWIKFKIKRIQKSKLVSLEPVER